MKKNYRITLFLLVLIADLVCIQLNNEVLQYIFKPLLMLILFVYFISQTKLRVTQLKTWIIAAILFSWLGDVLLMFQAKKKIFFLLGLSFFLVAHIFYIIFFHNIRVKEGIKSNPWLLMPVVVYYAGLIYLLSPYLGDMKLPVRAYGIVISFMFLLAMHMHWIKNKTAGRQMILGALLFVVSDSLLAIDKFYQPFTAAGILIILTYGLAQLFLTEGAIRYIRSGISS